MSEQILLTLKRKLDDMASRGSLDAETKRNILKEDLQFYVLNFIYHHPQYSKWTMYGGSSLRICHGLNRMSVDLDFEVDHVVNEKFLNTLKKDLVKYFTKEYGAGENFLTIKTTTARGLTLKFTMSDDFGFGQASKQVHVKIDLNNFTLKKAITERIPINRDQLSFVISTYHMSTLMASKIVAIFQRGTRGIGKERYEEKGRDIYDLLWYMEKKIVPDVDYMQAKNLNVKDPHELFEKLTEKMNKVSDANLKQDLTPLFVDQTYISNWLKNWRESYLRLLEGYKMKTVTKLEKIVVNENIHSDIFSFTYFYKTVEKETVRIKYAVTYEWIVFEKSLGIKINKELLKIVEFESDKKLSDQIKQFITLFHEKTETYLKKTKQIIIGEKISTKIIGTTTNKAKLLTDRLDDLLK